MNKEQLKSIITDQYVELTQKGTPAVNRAKSLDSDLEKTEVTVLTGVRRSGKSTLLESTILKLSRQTPVFFLSFEDSRLAGFELSDFQLAHEAWLEMLPETPTKQFLFYDEIQLVENWEKWINQLAKNKNYKIVITGSNSTLLSSELSSLLTGRHRVTELLPFSFKESVLISTGGSTEDLNLYSSSDKIYLKRVLNDYIKYGGFPRSFLDQDSSILKQYFRDIVTKDITLRHGLKSTKLLLQLGVHILTEGTKQVNKSKLASALGIKDTETLNKYLGYFEDTFLAFEVKKYDYSLKKQTRSLSKFFPIDTALAKQNSFRFSEDLGITLESLIFLELKRRGYTIYYWLSKNGYEVDFIAQKEGEELLAVQATTSLATNEVRERELRALFAAKEELGLTRFLVITGDSESFDGIPEEIESIPFCVWAMQEE